MSDLPQDPLAQSSIRDLAQSYRRGERKVGDVVSAYLSRIERLDPKIEAYEYVDREGAIEQAALLDKAFEQGRDPGPLAGIPVAIKDIVAVDGMPTHHGSCMNVTDLVSSEGRFVKRLREAGAVILGKVKTVEFAFGAVGLSRTRGMPHNPFDAKTKRITGGSSSGSAVAMAAGLCAFSIGSDTGASVRLPAALNGVPGQKTTVGLWPTDGVFPLSPTLDSLGTFAHTVDDLAQVFHAIENNASLAPRPWQGCASACRGITFSRSWSLRLRRRSRLVSIPCVMPAAISCRLHSTARTSAEKCFAISYQARCFPRWGVNGSMADEARWTPPWQGGSRRDMMWAAGNTCVPPDVVRNSSPWRVKSSPISTA